MDANVLFSACHKPSLINTLLAQCVASCEVVTCEIVLVEAARNLLKKRPDWLPLLSVWRPHVGGRAWSS